MEKMIVESKKGISRFGKSEIRDWYPSNINEAIENGEIISKIYGEICRIEALYEISAITKKHFDYNCEQYERKYDL